MKKLLSIVLSLSLVIGGFAFTAPKAAKADGEYNVISPNAPASNDRKNTTFMTSNANTPVEGFCYIGSGFTNINAVNENLGNGINMLGQTATTDEVALYVNMGADFDISYAKLYQGSTNNAFRNSYCKEYSIYYSTVEVNKTNKGADETLHWQKAGECKNGTIYNGSGIYKTDASLADQADTGDTINFTGTFTARSVKIVFEKDKCMGTGNSTGGGTTGTVSILSFQVYGVPHVEETTSVEEMQAPTQATTQAPTQVTTTQSETIINSDGDETMYGSYSTNLAQGKNGYASSNDRQDKNYAVKVGNLTDGSDISFIVTHSQDQSPWFAVDLGSVQDVNKIKVVPGGTGNYANSYPITYEIQVATENIALGDTASGVANLSWHTVKSVTGGSLAAKETTFAHQTTRWLRVRVTSQNSSYCSLNELYIYGTDKSTPYVEPAEATDVLFIGNSMTYYNTLCEVVEGLANHKGKTISCTAATNGGKNLIYQSTASNVDTAIKVGGYEIVVIQDIVGSFDADNLQTGADALITKIKQYNPSAQIIFYMPWPTKDTISNPNSKLPYFTNSYFKTASKAGAALAPAGEAFYDIYTNSGLDYYCSDNKHPQPLGTFISASTILYTMFPDLAETDYTSAEQDFLDNLINTNVDYTNEGQLSTYPLATLNLINSKGYYYAHAVATAMASNQKYTSVAGAYEDYEDIYNPDGLPAATVNPVTSTAFTAANGDIAIGKTSTASSGTASLGNNGDTGNRWESTHGVDPQWYCIDLGQATSFNTVGFVWEGAYAKQYVIQVSDDAENWTTVKYVKANSTQTVQIPLGQTYTKRYIRMVGFERGTQYGYSFWEMGVWNIEVEIDGDTVSGLSGTNRYTIPSTYEYGYINADDNNTVYKPGTELTLTKSLSLTAIKSLIVESDQSGASTRMVKSNPGLAFEGTVKVNGAKPILSDGFTYGMILTPKDIWAEFFDSSLVINNDATKSANVEIAGENDFYDYDEGIIKAGIMQIKEVNYSREFLSRTYMKINYSDGTSRVIYSDLHSKSRSIAGVAKSITEDSAYYNSLSASAKEAVDYFAGYAN